MRMSETIVRGSKDNLLLIELYGIGRNGFYHVSSVEILLVRYLSH